MRTSQGWFAVTIALVILLCVRQAGATKLCTWSEGTATESAQYAYAAAHFLNASHGGDWEIVALGVAGSNVNTSERARIANSATADCDYVIGPGSTHATAAVANAVAAPLIDPVVDAQTLSDRSVYPSFSRTTSARGNSVVAVDAVLRHYDWQTVSVGLGFGSEAASTAEKLPRVLARRGGYVERVLQLPVAGAATAAFDTFFNTLARGSTRIVLLCEEDEAAAKVFAAEANRRGATGRYVFFHGVPSRQSAAGARVNSLPGFLELHVATNDTSIANFITFAQSIASAEYSAFLQRGGLPTGGVVAIPASPSRQQTIQMSRVLDSVWLIMNTVSSIKAQGNYPSVTSQTIARRLSLLRAQPSPIGTVREGIALGNAGEPAGPTVDLCNTGADGSVQTLGSIPSGQHFTANSSMTAFLIGASGAVPKDVDSYPTLEEDDPDRDVYMIAFPVLGGVVALSALVALFVHMRDPNRHAPAADGKRFVTVLITRIYRSHDLWENAPGETRDSVIAHNKLMRGLFAAHRGYELRSTKAEEMVAVFNSADDALAMAVDLQLTFLKHQWGTEELDRIYRRLDQQKGLSADAPEVYKKLWNGPRMSVAICHGPLTMQLDAATNRFSYQGPCFDDVRDILLATKGGQIVASEEAVAAMQGSHNAIFSEAGTLDVDDGCQVRGVRIEPTALKDRRFPVPRTSSGVTGTSRKPHTSSSSGSNNPLMRTDALTSIDSISFMQSGPYK